MSNKKTFMFYAFDWDNNILDMPTTIYVDILEDGQWKPIEISTEEFAKQRNAVNVRPRNDSFDEMFLNFRDIGPNGSEVFLNDVYKAISTGSFGPSWKDLIECLINGCLFSIITARGHEESTIRSGVEYIINNMLTKDEKAEMYNNLHKFAYFYGKETKYNILYDIENFTSQPIVENYLDNCRFIGVSCESNEYSKFPSEKAKEMALMDFKKIINNASMKVGANAMLGFSDDDLKYIETIESMMERTGNGEYTAIVKMVVKNTSNPGNITSKIKYFNS